MPFLSHAGVSLRYDRAGSGPAVLLIHGWAANRTFWERQVQALCDKHTVITADLRGHGESSHPRSGYGIAAMAGDLEHLLRALAVPRVALVGWSMGGLVAQELASRLGDRLSALALVGTPAGGLLDDKAPKAQVERFTTMKTAIAKDFRGFVREFAPLLFKDGAEAPLVPWVIGQLQKTPAHVAEACFEAAASADLHAKAAKLKVPTAVLHGRHDGVIPLADAERIVKTIHGSKLTVFEQSGHMPPFEEPEALNAALAKLLA
jgi:pimeloyl-ACP methyl ester esterase